MYYVLKMKYANAMKYEELKWIGSKYRTGSNEFEGERCSFVAEESPVAIAVQVIDAFPGGLHLRPVLVQV